MARAKERLCKTDLMLGEGWAEEGEVKTTWSLSLGEGKSCAAQRRGSWRLSRLGEGEDGPTLGLGTHIPELCGDVLLKEVG